MSGIDNQKPPFAIGEGSPAEIAKQLASLYVDYDNHQPQIASIWLAATQAVGLDATSPFFRAGLKLAQTMDAGEGTGIEFGYHNTKHYIQVLLNATYLALRNQNSSNAGITLTSDEKGKLLFAALAHDFYYEPGGNKTSDGKPAPYRLEDISFLKARPYLEEQTVSRQDISDVGVMIYGTDVSPASKAGAFVRAAHAYHFENGTMPTVTEVLERVRPVLQNPRLARMAAMLGDADILSSAGFTPDFGDKETVKLRQEWGKTITTRLDGAEHTIGFLTNIVQNRFTTPEATFFQPNLEEIRETAQAAKSRASLVFAEIEAKNTGPR
jgi:hypothetical protein